VKNSTTATDRSVVQGFTSYDVVDPTTLRVTLPTAIGSFPALLQRSLGLIASPTAITKAGSSYGATPATIVGAGPFKVSEWVRDDHMTLVRSDNYWGAPKPYLDTLVLKPVPDSTQKANTLVAGQADMAWLPALSSADQVLTGAGVKSASVVQDGGIAIVYNTSKPPLNDVRVRKALTLAVDLEDLNAKSAAGLATMVQTFAPKGSPAYDPTVKQQTNKLAQAQKLIDAYVADHGGTPVSFNLLYSTSLKSWGDATLQQWSRLKNFNVTANLATPTVASAQGQAGNFDAWYASTTAARLTQFPETYYLLYRSGQATNLQKYSNPTLDKVLDANRDAVTAAERGQALQKISKVLVDDAAFTMIYRLAQRTYYTGRVHGVEMIDQSFPGTTTLWVGS
jgi:peptide/nickel transport system substrate-binding protein